MAEKKEPVETGEKTVRVMLHKDGNEHREDLFVAINMKEYRIPRGKPVDVPESVAAVIQNMADQEGIVLDLESGKKVK